MNKKETLPKLGFLYLKHVLQFFDKSNFKDWPDPIEKVTYLWGNDKQRLINEIKHKKIDVLIGNVPATAYETFREIARALPNVTFLPSLDSQFSNKSKENVTNFCHKYQLPTPKTNIFYDLNQADQFLKQTQYPKIIKRSYGPSNYGGFFVHKVDTYQQAKRLFDKKQYFPLYLQDFVPMKADIRVMLIGHKPVCAFWRRPPKGKWLTNTSQGGSMDYQDVPLDILNLAVNSSKAAKAEYWACDIALGHDGSITILECATAFAAFPYIRDWIGQYIMWTLSNGRFKKPNIPLYNWEELGKMDPKILRTLRHINFGRYTPSTDSNELFKEVDNHNFPLLILPHITHEEWPSEIWNKQGNFLKTKSVTAEPARSQPIDLDESTINQSKMNNQPQLLSERTIIDFLKSVSGIGNKMTSDIVNTLGLKGIVNALYNEPTEFYKVKNLKEKKLLNITAKWKEFETQ